MGTSPTGLLMYGYDLGGNEGWKLREAGEYGELALHWYDNTTDEGAEAEFVAEAMRRMLAEIVGFTETDELADGYHERARAAEEALGVVIQHVWTWEVTYYVLAARVVDASDAPEPVDFDQLERDRIELRFDDRLQAALDALGITPAQERPAWLLSSFYG